MMIGGFSQGAALSMVAAHTFPEKLAGIIALSGYLTGKKEIVDHWNTINDSTPVWMAHGDCDPMIPHALAKDSFEELLRLKETTSKDPKHTWSLYRGMQHSSSPEEMQDLFKFIEKTLPPVSAKTEGSKL